MSPARGLHILFLCARFPYPPYKGDQARAYHQIRLLSRRHRITLLSFCDAGVTAPLIENIRPLLEEVTLVPLRMPQMAVNLVRRLTTRLPAQAAMFSDNRMRRALQRCLTTGRFDLVHVQLARMATYLDDYRPLPRLIDLIDALSVNMARRAAREGQPRRLVLREESRRLQEYERSICDSYDAATVVSDADRVAIGDRANLFVNPNGVDLDSFRPRSEPRIPDRIIMTGNFGYFPNIDGLRWFTERVLPTIQGSRPNISVHVVGVNPHPDLQKLAATNSAIKIIGFAPDLAGHLSSASVAIVPLRSGSGMQFKVIEAMACGTPIVATTFGVGGLDVADGREILVADEPLEFADAVCRVLGHKRLRDDLAQSALRHVTDHFTWERVVSELEEIYIRAIGDAAENR